MIASIANGGGLVEPHVLKAIGTSAPKKIRLKLKKQNIDIVKEAMEGVVEDEDGTGHSAESSLVSISAKTGTVQIGSGISPHGWFVGFSPSENPKICFVVFLEHGGSGGEAPAQIAKQVIEYWVRNRGTTRKENE